MGFHALGVGRGGWCSRISLDLNDLIRGGGGDTKTTKRINVFKLKVKLKLIHLGGGHTD